LWVGGSQNNGLLENLLCLIHLLLRHQGYAFVDRGLGQRWIFLERLGKAVGGSLSELLAHQRHAAIVEADRLGVEARLRSGRCRK
jgi:hypothetical protein